MKLTIPVLALWAVAALACTAQALYSAGSPVVQLDPSNFKSKLKSGAWMVEFYAPWCGHCKALTPDWEKAAKGAKGLVNIAAVDADAHKELAAEYGIRGFPTIKFMYTDDSGKVKAVDYNGGRTAKDIIGFAFDKAKALALKRMGEKGSSGSAGSGSKGSGAGAGGSDGGFYSGTDVVTLTDDNFEERVLSSNDLWLVEFYAPWCGHCKALKPAWIEAAGELKGKVQLGAVDCTAHQSVCGQFSVQGYPTIKFFGAKKNRPEEYQGGRDSGSIVQFANQKWAALAPPPEVHELVDDHVWGKACVGDEAEGIKPKKVCLLAFLPDILDSKASGRNAYLKTLRKAAEAHKDKPWFGYLWAEGGKQSALEANVNVGGFGYPALVAYRPIDGKYSVCKSAFEAEHIKEWLAAITVGGARFVPLEGNGQLAGIQAHAPWDGMDAPAPVEEEFSLDDILNEEL